MSFYARDVFDLLMLHDGTGAVKRAWA